MSAQVVENNNVKAKLDEDISVPGMDDNGEEEFLYDSATIADLGVVPGGGLRMRSLGSRGGHSEYSPVQ